MKLDEPLERPSPSSRHPAVRVFEVPSLQPVRALTFRRRARRPLGSRCDPPDSVSACDTPASNPRSCCRQWGYATKRDCPADRSFDYTCSRSRWRQPPRVPNPCSRPSMRSRSRQPSDAPARTRLLGEYSRLLIGLGDLRWDVTGELNVYGLLEPTPFRCPEVTDLNILARRSRR